MNTETHTPWNNSTLKLWSIVGMNHYRINGIEHLFVAMTNKSGSVIIHEGIEDDKFWTRLTEKAQNSVNTFDTLVEALEAAKKTIKTWHNMNETDDTNWNIYDKLSPEMKKINSALKQAKP